MNEICCDYCGCSIKDLKKDDVPFKKGMKENSLICYNCVNSLDEIIEEELEEELNNEEDENINFEFDKNPLEIVKELDRFVVGQEKAKRTIALAAYQHYKRINDKDNELDKNNVMLIGPTGSGKTLIVKQLAKLLNVPFYIARANSITEAGYIGEDVDSIIEGLLEKCNGDRKRAELGIVFIDEIDKIRKAPDSNFAKDVSGLGTQNALLTILEDEEVVAYKRNEFKKPVKVNTKNILFIASGAFSGINDVVNKRLNKSNNKIGILSQNIKLEEDQDLNMDEVTNEDIINFGFVPEFVGRFPIITSLNGLKVKDLIRVIKEPENSILNQYIKLFEKENVQLIVTDEAIEEIAKEAIKKKTGARGIKSDFHKIFENALFSVCSNKNKSVACILDKDTYLKDKIAKIEIIKKDISKVKSARK